MPSYGLSDAQVGHENGLLNPQIPLSRGVVGDVVSLGVAREVVGEDVVVVAAGVGVVPVVADLGASVVLELNVHRS